MYNPFDFSNKKFAVAGATSAIGSALCRALSRQNSRLCLIGRDAKKLRALTTELGVSVYTSHEADFAVEYDCDSIFNDMVKDGAKLDGLVYAAGIADIQSLAALSGKRFNHTMTVNVYAFIEMVRVISKKKYHNTASIVGVSAISAQYPRKCQGVYAASKSAMNTLVQSFACELAPKGIRINTVLPAAVESDMQREAYSQMSPEQITRREDMQLMGLSRPDDIAEIIMFLLSDASRTITGRQIYADGGYVNF